MPTKSKLKLPFSKRDAPKALFDFGQNIRLFLAAALIGVIGNIIANGLWEFDKIWPWGEVNIIFVKQGLFVMSLICLALLYFYILALLKRFKC
ncbi:MAG: hypothetical protein WCW13_02170 [archaeon]|jgi:hypothetical protein